MRKIKLISIAFFITINSIWAIQPVQIKGIVNASGFCPSQSHVGNSFFSDSITVSYAYPGFFTNSGDLSLFLSENKNIYKISAGYPYIALGYSKSVSNSIYINLTLSNIWGSAGISKIIMIDNNKICELLLDMFINRGYDFDMFGGLPNYRGILNMCNFTINGNNKLTITCGLGLSLIQIKEGQVVDDAGKWEYITAKNSKSNLIINSRWSDFFVMFPFNISFNINF